MSPLLLQPRHSMSSSSPACPDAQDDAPRCRPYEYQRNLGGDMTLMFFVTTGSDMPAKCPLRDRQLIRGLDAEATARVMFPKPPWLTKDQRYRSLLRTAEADDDAFSQGFFSLNMCLLADISGPKPRFGQVDAGPVLLLQWCVKGGSSCSTIVHS